MKSTKKITTFFLMSALCLAGFSREATAQTAQWTVLVYLDGDNNLESNAITDFMEMASVGSDTDVKIAVLFDRIAGYDSTYDNWTDTRRGIVEADDNPDTSWGLSLGELNMGNPQTLIDFVEWGMQTYPAARYAVVLWDHGSGWHKGDQDSLLFKSVCDDDTQGDRLFMQELRNALETIETDEGEPDLLGFDACLMGMVEVAYEIRNQSSVMVASEKKEPGSGWPFDTILTDLVTSPSMTPSQLGSAIVSRYYQSFENDEILSSIDLSAMDNLATKVDALALALRYNWNNDTGACVQAACCVMSAVESAVMSEEHGSSWPGTHGLALYYPEFVGEFNSDYNGTTILFPLNTRWEEFLSDFYTYMSGSWVADARDQSQEYNACTGWCPYHIDLYDFCEKLIENASGLIWVDFSYAGVESGTHDQPYNTLAEGVTAASVGQTICIKPGSTAETFDITKGLTLRACGGMAIISE